MIQAEAKLQKIIDDKSSSVRKAAKLILENRTVQKDRRRINTFIADDKRSGIADRRKRR
jgi:hypothetical protein